MLFGLLKTLEEVESPHNGKIQVVQTFEGVRILVGGISQSGWLVKKVWDEALKKIKKIKPEAKKILILGLGGGSIAELTERYWPDSKKTGVDIDEIMVDIGKKYLKLKTVNNLQIEIADAKTWVSVSKSKFELILIDLYKGQEIPHAFRTIGFMKKVRQLLNQDGIVAFNHLYSYKEKKDANIFQTTLHKVFSAMTTVTPEANIIFICQV